MAKFPFNPISDQPLLDLIAKILDNLILPAVVVGDAYLTFCDWLERIEHKAQQDHLRGERLSAYKLRKKWKTSDVRPLLFIGVNEGAQRRIAKLKGKGRPIVKHRALDDIVSEKLTKWLSLFCENATPNERRAMEVWPWWKHCIGANWKWHEKSKIKELMITRREQSEVHCECRKEKSTQSVVKFEQ